jgi:IS5 family transposase
MSALMQWARLLNLIAPHFLKAGAQDGHPLMHLETMLRAYFLRKS